MIPKSTQVDAKHLLKQGEFSGDHYLVWRRSYDAAQLLCQHNLGRSADQRSRFCPDDEYVGIVVGWNEYDDILIA